MHELFGDMGGGGGLTFDPAPTRHVMPARTMDRLLAFAGRSLDDVINSRVAKREILHWYKVNRQLDRRREVGELEMQWNPLGRMG